VTAHFERIILRVSRTPMARIAEWPPRRRGALVEGVERGSRRGGLGQREATLACATAASPVVPTSMRPPDPTTTVCVKTSALTAWMTLLEVTSTTAGPARIGEARAETHNRCPQQKQKRRQHARSDDVS